MHHTATCGQTYLCNDLLEEGMGRLMCTVLTQSIIHFRHKQQVGRNWSGCYREEQCIGG